MKCIFLFPFVASVLMAQTPALLAALATGTYFPLDVGDRWVYRIDSPLRDGLVSDLAGRSDRDA